MFDFIKPIKTIFIVQIFERFSYYGFRSCLILFLINKLKFDDSTAYAVFSAYVGLVYGLPILGSFLTDRIFGMKLMMKYGLLINLIGHFCVGFSIYSENFIFLALGFFAVGVSFYKSNITNLIGEYYKDNEAKRSAAFTFVHVGVNIGACLGPIICGYAYYFSGYYFAFMLAAIGNLISYILLLIFYNNFEGKGEIVNQDLNYKYLFFFISIILSFAIGFVIKHNYFNEDVIFYLATAALIFYFYLMYCYSNLKFLFAGLILIFFNILIGVIEYQYGSLITVVAERNVVNNILGFPVPAVVGLAINPLTVILFGLYFAKQSYSNLKQIFNFLIGILLSATSFFVVYFGCLMAVDNNVGYFYYAFPIFMLSIAELYFTPFFLSNITLLSPAKAKSFMISMLMLSNTFSSFIGLQFNKYMAVDSLNKAESLKIYTQGFQDFGYIFTGIAILITPLIFIFNYLKKRN